VPLFAAAQAYPAKQIHIVVPFPPGGPTDVLGRVLGQSLGEAFGQTVVVDNKVGAAGNIGVDAVAKAAPDGYTIGIVPGRQRRGQSDAVREPAVQGRRPRAGDDAGDRRQRPRRQRRGGAGQDDEGAARPRREETGRAELRRRPAPAARRTWPARCSS
jgi:hypothetical protein